MFYALSRLYTSPNLYKTFSLNTNQKLPSSSIQHRFFSVSPHWKYHTHFLIKMSEEKPPRNNLPTHKEDEEESQEDEELEPEYINPVTGERGGRKGHEPTRYGDWEKGGRCVDF